MGRAASLPSLDRPTLSVVPLSACSLTIRCLQSPYDPRRCLTRDRRPSRRCLPRSPLFVGDNSARSNSRYEGELRTLGALGTMTLQQPGEKYRVDDGVGDGFNSHQDGADVALISHLPVREAASLPSDAATSPKAAAHDESFAEWQGAGAERPEVGASGSAKGPEVALHVPSSRPLTLLAAAGASADAMSAGEQIVDGTSVSTGESKPSPAPQPSKPPVRARSALCRACT